MSEARRLARNFAALLAGNVCTRLAGFISTLYLARMLGPADFGLLSFALALTFALSFLINGGLDNLLIREVARAPERSSEVLGDALVVKLVTLPLGILVALLLSLTDPSSLLLFFFLSGYTVAFSYLLLCGAVFRGLERMWYQTLMLGAQSLLTAIGAVVAVHLTGQVVPVVAVYMFSTALALAAGYLMLVRKGLRPHYRWRPAAWWRLLRTTLPFGLIAVGLAVYDRQTIVVIGLFSGKAAAGWFNAAYAIVPVLGNLPANLVNTLFPLLSRRSQPNPRAIATACETILRYNNATSFPLAAILFFLAPSVILLLFGDAYRESTILLQIMALGLPFIFLTVILSGVLQANDRQRSCAVGLWRSLAIAVPGCLAATWLWGYTGGTVAYLLSHVLLATVLFVLVIRAIGPINVLEAFGRPALVTVGVGLVAYLVRQGSLFLVLPLLLVCYGVLLLLTGTVGKREWALLQDIWPSRLWRSKLVTRLSRSLDAGGSPRGGGS